MHTQIEGHLLVSVFFQGEKVIFTNRTSNWRYLRYQFKYDDVIDVGYFMSLNKEVLKDMDHQYRLKLAGIQAWARKTSNLELLDPEQIDKYFSRGHPPIGSHTRHGNPGMPGYGSELPQAGVSDKGETVLNRRTTGAISSSSAFAAASMIATSAIFGSGATNESHAEKMKSKTIANSSSSSSSSVTSTDSSQKSTDYSLGVNIKKLVSKAKYASPPLEEVSRNGLKAFNRAYFLKLATDFMNQVPSDQWNGLRKSAKVHALYHVFMKSAYGQLKTETFPDEVSFQKSVIDRVSSMWLQACIENPEQKSLYPLIYEYLLLFDESMAESAQARWRANFPDEKDYDSKISRSKKFLTSVESIPATSDSLDPKRTAREAKQEKRESSGLRPSQGKSESNSESNRTNSAHQNASCPHCGVHVSAYSHVHSFTRHVQRCLGSEPKRVRGALHLPDDQSQNSNFSAKHTSKSRSATPEMSQSDDITSKRAKPSTSSSSMNSARPVRAKNANFNPFTSLPRGTVHAGGGSAPKGLTETAIGAVALALDISSDDNSDSDSDSSKFSRDSASQAQLEQGAPSSDEDDTPDSEPARIKPKVNKTITSSYGASGTSNKSKTRNNSSAKQSAQKPEKAEGAFRAGSKFGAAVQPKRAHRRMDKKSGEKDASGASDGSDEDESEDQIHLPNQRSGANAAQSDVMELVTHSDKRATKVTTKTSRANSSAGEIQLDNESYASHAEKNSISQQRSSGESSKKRKAEDQQSKKGQSKQPIDLRDESSHDDNESESEQSEVSDLESVMSTASETPNAAKVKQRSYMQMISSYLKDMSTDNMLDTDETEQDGLKAFDAKKCVDEKWLDMNTCIPAFLRDPEELRISRENESKNCIWRPGPLENSKEEAADIANGLTMSAAAVAKERESNIEAIKKYNTELSERRAHFKAFSHEKFNPKPTSAATLGKQRWLVRLANLVKAGKGYKSLNHEEVQKQMKERAAEFRALGGKISSATTAVLQEIEEPLSASVPAERSRSSDTRNQEYSTSASSNLAEEFTNAYSGAKESTLRNASHTGLPGAVPVPSFEAIHYDRGHISLFMSVAYAEISHAMQRLLLTIARAFVQRTRRNEAMRLEKLRESHKLSGSRKGTAHLGPTELYNSLQLKRYGHPSHMDLLHTDDHKIMPIVDGTLMFHKPETPTLLLRILNEADGNVAQALSELRKHLNVSSIQEPEIGADSDDYGSDSDVQGADSEVRTLINAKQLKATALRSQSTKLTVESFVASWSLGEQTRFQTAFQKVGPNFSKLSQVIPSKTTAEIADYYFRFIESATELLTCDNKEASYNTANHSGDQPANLNDRKRRQEEFISDAVGSGERSDEDSEDAEDVSSSQGKGADGDQRTEYEATAKRRIDEKGESAVTKVQSMKDRSVRNGKVDSSKALDASTKRRSGIDASTQKRSAETEDVDVRLQSVEFFLRAKRELSDVSFTLLLNCFKAMASLSPESPAQLIVRIRVILGFNALSCYNMSTSQQSKPSSANNTLNASAILNECPYYSMMPFDSTSAKKPFRFDEKVVASLLNDRASDVAGAADRNKELSTGTNHQYNTLKGSFYTKPNNSTAISKQYIHLSKAASACEAQSRGLLEMENSQNATSKLSLYAEFLKMLPDVVGDQAGLCRLNVQ